MKFTKENKFWLYAVAILSILFCGMLMGYDFCKNRFDNNDPVIEIDTVVKIDTIKMIEIEYDTEYVEKWKLIPINIYDTIVENDTTYLELPFTQKHYIKPDTLEAWVSGFEPNLDSVSVFVPKETITITKYETKNEMTPFNIFVGGSFTHSFKEKNIGAAYGEFDYNSKNTTFGVFGGYCSDFNGDNSPFVGGKISYRIDF